MGRYKKIVKKKDIQSSLLTDEAEATDWLAESSGRIALFAGLILLCAVVVYGAGYYKKTAFNDSHERLFFADSVTPEINASRGQIDQGVTEFEKVIEAGGPEGVVTQARLHLASLYAKRMEYGKAVGEYDKVTGSALKGTMFHELAQAGKASVLLRKGSAEEATPILEELSGNAKFYPKSEALYSLAFAYLSSGKKSEAKSSFIQLKTDYPSFVQGNYIDNLIKDVDNKDMDPAFIAELAKAANTRDDSKVFEGSQGGGLKVHDQ